MAKNVKEQIKEEMNKIKYEDIPVVLNISVTPVKKVIDCHDKYKCFISPSFLVDDISIICNVIGEEFNNINIINITGYRGIQEEKEKYIKDFVDLFKNTDNVICTESYVSMEEFPPDKYYLPELTNPKEINSDMEVLPVEEIIGRESKMLESLGFVSINNFTKYEYKEAFIYPNKFGKAVIDKMNGLLRKSED